MRSEPLVACAMLGAQWSVQFDLDSSQIGTKIARKSFPIRIKLVAVNTTQKVVKYEFCMKFV